MLTCRTCRPCCYPAATLLLPCCYLAATLLLPCCYLAATLLLPCCSLCIYLRADASFFNILQRALKARLHVRVERWVVQPTNSRFTFHRMPAAMKQHLPTYLGCAISTRPPPCAPLTRPKPPAPPPAPSSQRRSVPGPQLPPPENTRTPPAPPSSSTPPRAALPCPHVLPAARVCQ